MRLLIVLQSLSALIYYVTAPFSLTFWIWMALVINAMTLAFLWVTSIDIGSRAFRFARAGFTITILLLEVAIGLTDSPISTTELQGIANDAEVLFTGILLGTLWHDFLTGKPKKPSAS